MQENQPVRLPCVNESGTCQYISGPAFSGIAVRKGYELSVDVPPFRLAQRRAAYYGKSKGSSKRTCPIDEIEKPWLLVSKVCNEDASRLRCHHFQKRSGVSYTVTALVRHCLI